MSEPSAVLRTVIASDNFLTREGLGSSSSGAPGVEIVARVDSHPEALTAIRQYRPNVLIVGIRTPALTPRRRYRRTAVALSVPEHRRGGYR